MYRLPAPKAARSASVPIPTRNSPLRIWKFALETQAKFLFKRSSDREIGIWLREEMISLGPAFIKMGQFMSTRSDIIGKDLSSELVKLQDNIDFVDGAQIISVISSQINQPIDSIFKSIDVTPLASASIGQVHRGVLQDGTQVAIKVLKPGAAKRIKEDLETLNAINQFFFKLQFPRAKEIDRILKQYESFLKGELDYKNELQQMLKFRDLLDGLDVVIPKPYLEYSTDIMLVMDYVSSHKINDIAWMDGAKINKSRVANNFVSLFLYQIISCGFVHCDPHPGNVGVLDDGETLVLYDFGNVVTLDENFRNNVNNLIVAIYQKDVDEFLELLLSMKIIEVRDEAEVLELRAFFELFFVYLETVDFSKLKMSMIESDVVSQANIDIKIDANFLSLFRIFSLMDGTCASLDPNFSYYPLLVPFTEDIFRDLSFLDYRVRKDIKKLTSFPATIRNTNLNILQLNQRVKKTNAMFSQYKFLIATLAAMEGLEGLGGLDGGAGGGETSGAGGTIKLVAVLAILIATLSAREP
jgi:ubiquinone biosynthesis protein